MTNVSETERGMTGIGVLILFIALVLVAAIASGLILDTAGMLQNTAQNTGEQSTSEVSDRLSVLSSSGEVEAVDNVETVGTNTDNPSLASDGTAQSVSYTVAEGEHLDSIVLNGVSVDSSESTASIGVAVSSPSSPSVPTSDQTVAAGETEDLTFDIDMADVTASGGTEVTLDITSDTAADITGDIEFVGTNGEANAVSELGMTVYRSPGAGDVDLQHATIEYFGPDGTAFLIHEQEYQTVQSEGREDEFAENLGSFGTEAVKDDDGSIPVLNSRDDRASMTVGLHNHSEYYTGPEPAALDNLSAGESATLRLTTQNGATTTQIVNVPESLAGYDGSTVML